MDISEAEALLINHGIRPTAVRTLLIRTLYSQEAPVSTLQIEKILDTVDRSTISRSLVLMHGEGLLHAVDDGSGSLKYEICRGRQQHDGFDSDLHGHFHCTICGRTLCLHDISIPDLHLPEEYEVRGATLMLTGICPKCSKRQHQDHE